MVPYYRCPKCSRVGTAREMETHLAEQHHTFYPHHCRTCGYRTYDKAAIYEQCVSLKHKVVFWEVREEEQEGLLEEDLEACLRHPVLIIEPKPYDTDSIEVVDTGESKHAANEAPQQWLDETLQADVTEMAQPEVEIVSVSVAERVPPTTREKQRRKYGRNLQIHTAMTCHFDGCGEEIVARGNVAIGGVMRRHIQGRHLADELDLRCPVHGCGKKFTNVDYIACHLGNQHGGVKALDADELASHRATQKHAVDACSEMLSICFPSGAVSRDRATARKTCNCAKCGKSVEAYLDKLIAVKRSHIEKEHLSGCKIKCPVNGCTSRGFSDLFNLMTHIGRRHGGTASLNNEELAVYRTLKTQIDTATNKLIFECFPDVKVD